MVLNLKIQPAHKPGNEFIMSGKIGCCIYLVYRPLIFNFIRLNIRNRECRVLYGMRQLKYDADQKSSHNGCDKKSD